MWTVGRPSGDREPRRTSRPGRVGTLARLGAAVLVGTAGLALPARSSPVRAASPEDANPLDVPMVDAAILSGGTDGGSDPGRLLVVRPAAEPDGSAADGAGSLELLVDDRDGWRTASTLSLDEGRPTSDLLDVDLDATPWLLPLPTGSGAIVVRTAGGGARSILGRYDVVGDGIVAGRALEVAGPIDGAGLADVDGDGSVELVTSTPEAPGRTPPAPGRCRTVVSVRDPVTLAPLRTIDLWPWRLGPATLVDVDLDGTVELVAPIAEVCDSQFAADRGSVALVRLTTGPTDVIVGLDPPTGPPVAPIPVRVDAGPPVLVLPSGSRMVVVDPAEGWTAIDLGDDARRPLGVVGSTRGATIALATIDTDGRPWAVRRVTMARGTAGPLEMTDLEGPPRSPRMDRWSDAAVPARWATWPVGWSGDVDGDGCDDLVVPFLSVDCAGAPVPRVRRGPAWVATRPLGIVVGRERRLLVASGLAWDLPLEGLRTPTPAAAAEATGGWRSGPSVPFALAELRAKDLFYFTTFPAPVPTLDEWAGADPVEAIVAGRAGDRVMSRVRTGPPAARSDPAERSVAAFLAPEIGIGVELRVDRSPVRPGGIAGVELRAVRVPLRGDAQTWWVEAIELNDWGEISEPVAGAVRLDLVGPSLAVPPPLLSAPWPFSAKLTGTTESGATVEVIGGETVQARRNGTFEIRTTLAPWPQDVVIRATDGEGNATLVTISVVGGLDVRRLPWEAILVLGVLAVVAAAALRDASRAVRASAAADRVATDEDDGPRAVIEEL